MTSYTSLYVRGLFLKINESSNTWRRVVLWRVIESHSYARDFRKINTRIWQYGKKLILVSYSIGKFPFVRTSYVRKLSDFFFNNIPDKNSLVSVFQFKLIDFFEATTNFTHYPQIAATNIFCPCHIFPLLRLFLVYCCIVLLQK